MSSAAPLTLHPDRLLPADPGVRAIARRLYAATRDRPLICPHGHVSAAMLQADAAFSDPTSLLVSSDHYVTRLLHAAGTSLADLGGGPGPMSPARSRSAWRTLCANWPVLRGTPVRYWLEAQLVEVFGVAVRPSAESADLIYDQIDAALTEAAYRPRALCERFGIEVLATTDDPVDDLAAHAVLADDPQWGPRVLPTFRPDRYLELAVAGWADSIERLGSVAGCDTATYGGYLEALQRRREYFIAHGATSADHSHLDAGTQPLPVVEAERIYRSALSGTVDDRDASAFRRHMIFEMARMSVEDGLVMTLHPGVLRGHHRPTTAKYGPDIGNDIPVPVEFTTALRPLLERFGTHPNLHLVLFTVDESTYSRELAPLAGFYPSVYLGAPWWFLDAPAAMRRFRSTITETIGFARTAGFVDDTRALCSVPARHDMARRIDAGYLAGLVSEHVFDEDEAAETALELVTDVPRIAFKL